MLWLLLVLVASVAAAQVPLHGGLTSPSVISSSGGSRPPTTANDTRHESTTASTTTVSTTTASTTTASTTTASSTTVSTTMGPAQGPATSFRGHQVLGGSRPPTTANDTRHESTTASTTTASITTASNTTASTTMGPPTSFRGHQVLRVVPTTERQVHDLRNFLHEHVSVDPWTDPTSPGRPVDIHVNPTDGLVLKEFLSKHNLSSKEMITDLGRMIDTERWQMVLAQRSKIDYGWENYHTLDEMYKWMQGLAQKYTEVAVIEGGRTYEGRVIQGVRIKFTYEDLPIAVIEAGIHAREWITPATATFLINEILTREDEDFKSAVRAYEWHIFPSMNPDGYVYTHNVNRMWRKSRSKHYYFCAGVDLNRNWPFHWRDAGSSVVPCSEQYAGPKPESEVETKSMRRYLDALMERPNNPVKVYISLHSYSQLLMFPWGWTTEPAKTHDELNSIAGLAVQAAAKRYGTKYKFGPIAKTIYLASGSTIDYAYDKGVKYPFIFELRDEGIYGFLLPKELIKPTAEETVDAIITIVCEAAKRK